MKIQILGTGCAKCKALEEQALEAINVGSLDATVEKIVDMQDIMDLGVLLTPALAVDGVVVSAGKVLKADQILALVQGGR